jgi:hypothetical protein
LRNIFDQYSQNENRLTHAFASILHHDPKLKSDFLQKFLGLSKTKAKACKISVQAYPDGPPLDLSEVTEKGIPDIWFYDDDGWCAVVECKITADLNLNQVERHVRTALKRGYDEALPVIITAKSEAGVDTKDIIHLNWPTLYTWLRQQAPEQQWAQIGAEYFETLEQQMVRDSQLTDGALTTFSGFPIGLKEAYSYFEAKRLLVLAMAELRKSRRLQDILGVDPSLEGKKAITGSRETSVWDYLRPHQSTGKFNEHIHFTFGINNRNVKAMLTLPDSMDRSILKRLKLLGLDGFITLLNAVVQNAAPLLEREPFAIPSLQLVQRRYPSQKSEPFMDGEINVDLRTALRDAGPVKYQPQWIAAAYDAFCNKEANLQMQIGFQLPHGRCPGLQKESALDLIVEAWCACKPVMTIAYPD